MTDKDITIKLNRDNLKTKEDQLKELNTDYQNHISKMQQLLSFFAATLALVFGQDALYKIPGQFLGIIFILVIIFLIICYNGLQGKQVEGMVKIPYWTGNDEEKYLEQKIGQIESAKGNMLKIINQQNLYNKWLSTIFIILIALYSFIFLIYIPMTNNDEQEVNLEVSSNEQTMSLETITKTSESTSGSRFVQTPNQE